MRPETLVQALLVATLIASQSGGADEPKATMHFPNPGKCWELIKYKDSKPSIPWYTDVFVNTESSDLLSFAARRVNPTKPRKLVYWSDSAREIFPIGHPVWTTSSTHGTTSNTIRNGVVKINALDPEKRRHHPQAALEYSLVVETPRDRKRMVHGYAFIIDGVAIFVQHTSTNPITSELARTPTKSLIAKCRQGTLKPIR